MARALIVGCGCRGRSLGARLADDGWAVRGTSRTEAGLEAIRAAGLEAAVADPLEPGGIVELVADVTVLVVLLGSASGGEEDLIAIHRDRLGSLLEKLVDTPVRGIAYELAGTAPAAALAAARDLLTDAGRRWQIPWAAIDADPSNPAVWGDAAISAVRSSLG